MLDFDERQLAEEVLPPRTRGEAQEVEEIVTEVDTQTIPATLTETTITRKQIRNNRWCFAKHILSFGVLRSMREKLRRVKAYNERSVIKPLFNMAYIKNLANEVLKDIIYFDYERYYSKYGSLSLIYRTNTFIPSLGFQRILNLVSYVVSGDALLSGGTSSRLPAFGDDIDKFLNKFADLLIERLNKLKKENDLFIKLTKNVRRNNSSVQIEFQGIAKRDDSDAPVYFGYEFVLITIQLF